MSIAKLLTLVVASLCLWVPGCTDAGDNVTVVDEPLGGIVVSHPTEGQSLESPSVLIEGRGEGGMACCAAVELAVRKDVDGRSCDWFNWSTQEFLRRSCRHPDWKRVYNFLADNRFEAGEEWSYRLPVALVPGTYELIARDRKLLPREQSPTSSVTFNVLSP